VDFFVLSEATAEAQNDDGIPLGVQTLRQRAPAKPPSPSRTPRPVVAISDARAARSRPLEKNAGAAERRLRTTEVFEADVCHYPAARHRCPRTRHVAWLPMSRSPETNPLKLKRPCLRSWPAPSMGSNSVGAWIVLTRSPHFIESSERVGRAVHKDRGLMNLGKILRSSAGRASAVDGVGTKGGLRRPLRRVPQPRACLLVGRRRNVRQAKFYRTQGLANACVALRSPARSAAAIAGEGGPFGRF